MKIKIDRYEVYDKKKVHKILVFPKLEHMWVYDAHPREETFNIDGSAEDMKKLAVALAALIDDPTKLIYFPIKTGSDRIYYQNCGYLLMTGSDNNFCNSKWYDIKSKINLQHRKGMYMLDYQEDEINDYYEHFIKKVMHKKREKENWKHFKQKLLGDTVFMKIPKDYCFEFHESLTTAITVNQKYDEYVTHWLLGCILGHKNILDMEVEERAIQNTIQV